MSQEQVRLLVELDAANRAYQRAVDEMDEAATSHVGVNRSDGRGLDVLEERGPLTASELAAACHLSPGAITALVDRLERAGFVRRVRDDEDRRRVLVELTAAARQAVWELYAPLGEGGTPWLAGHTAAELRTIRDFLRFGADLNLEQAARIRALPPREPGRRRHPRPA